MGYVTIQQIQQHINDVLLTDEDMKMSFVLCSLSGCVCPFLCEFSQSPLAFILKQSARLDSKDLKTSH